MSGSADLPTLVRFLSKVRMNALTSCWEWQGCKTLGYGRFMAGGRQDMAHRTAYGFFIGPIPDGSRVIRRCKSVDCVNPAHLKAVSGADPCRGCGAADRNTSGNCRPCARVRTATWKKENPARVRETRAVYYRGNLERERAYRAVRYWGNLEKERASSLAWAKANPGRACASANRRRARIAGAAEGTVTPEDRAFILSENDGKCIYCDDRRATEVDHVVPLAKGGAHAVHNLTGSCRTCNSSKGSKLLCEWTNRPTRGEV